MSSNSAWFIASTINRVCKQEALIWKYELVFRKREYNGKHQKILSCNGQKRPLLTNCLSLGTVATCLLRSRDATFSKRGPHLRYIVRTTSCVFHWYCALAADVRFFLDMLYTPHPRIHVIFVHLDLLIRGSLTSE